MQKQLRDSKDDILEKVYEKGNYYEGKYGGCAQGVVAALSDLFNINETVFKMASGFSGGIADEAKGTCGTFSGSIMVISYFFGRDRKNYGLDGSKFKDCELIKKLRRRFLATYGGETCPVVQTFMFGKKYDFNNPDEVIAFEEAGAHRDKCTHVVGTAAKWVTEILLDEGIPFKKDFILPQHK